MTLWLALACAPAPAPAPNPASAPAAPAPAPAAPAPAADTPDARAFARADALIDQAAKRLQDRMVQSMSLHGPADAAETCSIEAEALTDGVTAPEPGALVGRASLRLRNPGNAGPDWVHEWLVAQGERSAAGVDGVRRVQATPDGPVAQVLRPIVVQPHCLTCHGAKETLKADVRAVIERYYPDDSATGYQIGDLRGAMWAQVPVRGG